MANNESWQDKLDAFDGLSLDLSDSEVTSLPPGLRVRFSLNLAGCLRLRQLPAGLQAGSLILTGCTNLAALSEGLRVSFLDISGCSQLTDWPQQAALEAGRLRAHDCTGITHLPPWIQLISQLDLRGCTNLRELPDSLRVTSWIDLADTGITSLPESLDDTALRWKGVPIDKRIAFRPEEISGHEVLTVANAELRRVMLERIGFARFLTDVEAKVIDEDTDPGGPRQLVRVVLGDDEPLVCVCVHCPSTGRQYVIRVPPNMQSCRQAIAWTAGFDDPRLYQPIVET